MNYLYPENIKISQEWFETGNKYEEKSPSDVAFKFISYWISFNGLFSKYGDPKTDTEENQIRQFIDRYYDDYLIGLIDFDTADECEIFRELPVFNSADKRYRTPTKSKEHYLKCEDSAGKKTPVRIERFQTFINGKCEKERLIALILTIKQVRNNLFHGQKNPEPERNFKLVDSSQKILKKLLDAVIVIDS